MVLIDGMEGGINAVNPQDIENISALKDAAVSSICGACVALVLLLQKAVEQENRL